MKKALQITGIIAAVIVVFFACLAVVAKIIITPERVKRTVLPIAEKALHRQVQLGDIRISIFSGIVLKDLVVMEKQENVPFVKAAQVKLRYQFWPLLARRVVVDEINLDSPRIRVVRMPDGSFNYTDILAKKEPAAKPEAKGEMDLMVSKVALKNGEVQFEDRGVKSGSPIVYAITGIDVSAEDISPEKPFPFTVQARVTGASVEMKGKAATVSTRPSIDAVVRLSEGDVRKIAAELPPALAARAKPFEPAGGITARLHLAGPVSTPKELLKDGEIHLDKVEVTASGQRLSLSGDLAVTGASVSSRNLAVAMAQNSLKMEFAASNILGKPITVSSAVTADRFDLDPFLKKPAGKAAVPVESAKPEPGPLNLPVRASGTVQLGQTTYKGLPVTQLFLKYRLIDNVLDIDELKGTVAGGSFTDTARADLRRKGFVYSTRLAIRGVQAAPVVAAFAPKATGTVSGTLSLDTDLNGSGIQAASIKKNLGGHGNFAVTDGKLTGAGLVQGLARYINLEQLRVLQFSKFAGTFRIEKGKIRLDSSVSGKDVQITPKGSIGLDKSLDLSLVTMLSPDLAGRMGKGEIRNLLTNEKGWGVLPLKVGGTVSSPRFGLDPSALRKQMKTKAREKIEQTIEEKLLKKKPGQPQRPEQELLEKGIKGIFGK